MEGKTRILLILLVLIILVGAVLGFIAIRNRSGNSSDGSTPTSTGGDVELVYWGLWESEAIMQEVISEYEKENSGITIKYTQKRFTQYEDNVYERLADAQTTPDIVRINNTWTYKFQSRLSPVPPEIMSSSEYQQAFYSAAMDDFMGMDGKLYAIPLEIDGLAMYYNKDLFTKAGISEPPSDWDTLIEVAKKLTETDSSGTITQAGVALGCSNNINHSADILTALMLQNNVQMTSSDATEATFNSSRGEDSLTYYTDFVNTHKVWSCSLRNDLEMFTGGKLAMMFGPSWRTFDIINMNSSINFGTANLPQLPANDVDISYGMYWGDTVSAQSPNQLEAWRFIKYLSEKEQLQKIYAAAAQTRAFGEPYSRTDLASELQDAPYVSAFIDQGSDYVGWKLGDQQTAEAALNKAISDVVDSRSSVSSALDEAAATVNDKYSELYGLE